MAGERRTFASPHLRTFAPSHLRTFAPSHLCSFAPSHLRTFAPFWLPQRATDAPLVSFPRSLLRGRSTTLRERYVGD
eukprot:8317271-Pyramimonas_sp.AAC.1